ncbi:MAG TPA: histidine kinase [Bacteroidota bacterium]|nr:histidine kinase [Bacteroidota bacterium]
MMNVDPFAWSAKKKWMIITGVYLLIAFWQAGVFIADNVANYEPANIGRVFINEVSGSLLTLVMLPLLLAFFEHVPLRRPALGAKTALYLLVWIVYGSLLTVMFYTSRTVLYPMLGAGEYQYGDFLPRLVMETIKQFFVFWLIYLIRLYVITLHESNEQRLRAARLEQELSRSRLQTLQMQLNPHFLFNTLNVISSTMYENVKTADTMIATLSDLLRQTLNAMNWEVHPLRKEMELLGLYFTIMKQRFNDTLRISTRIDADCSDALLPGFIIQPLAENAIRFSMERDASPEISVTACRAGQMLVITVTDNGPGIPPDFDITATKGVGLANAIERLRTLYGREQSLELSNRPEGGLCVTIRMPFRLSEEVK